MSRSVQESLGEPKYAGVLFVPDNGDKVELVDVIRDSVSDLGAIARMRATSLNGMPSSSGGKYLPIYPLRKADGPDGFEGTYTNSGGAEFVFGKLDIE